MIKGCRKNIIHITNTGSPYFEEAYFVVRLGGDVDISDDDMVREATRIAEVTGDEYKKKNSKKRRVRLSFFLYGASVCSFVLGLIMLLYS